LDNGSSFIKAGVAGEEVPRSVLPTIAGRKGDSTYVGFAALEEENIKDLCSPLDPSFSPTTNWENITEIWEYIFSHELGVNPQMHPVLIL
jgi:actin-related protein